MNKTICAISTPLGRGAISIVRMSGPQSLDIMKLVFSSPKLNYNQIIPRYLYLGNLKLDESNEKCLGVYFKAPNTYTGEDIVEFQIHGGTYLTECVLNLLIDNGARLAENGEFTKRAFENGKISLDVAESIIDEINAESESELKSSLSLAEGKLYKQITSMQNSLTECLAKIEASLDYPEEDIEEETKNDILSSMSNINSDICKLIDFSKHSQIIKNGVNIALIGSPNVGKSSTLNALIGENRAIVTDIEGTTRDTLTESVFYKGIKFNFIDTAGIRNSFDEVEKIGIKRAKQSIEMADVILFLIDGSREISDFDNEIISLLQGRENVITIINKSDLPRKVKSFQDEIVISALNENNIESIKEKIFNMVVGEKIDYNHNIVVSARQLQILNDCKNVCTEINSAKNESMDIIALLIKKLWNLLGKITGQCENEDIIDLIFSKFCLGK